ncbi:MAG: DegQ family serine endoprotease [Rhodospirillaceae bacterium]|nr:DegQ family serine endoprotease [Rhodospirillaceae bacterium]
MNWEFSVFQKLFMAGVIGLGAMMSVAAPQAFARTPPDSFADLTEKLLPAVVNISTTQTVQRRGGELDDLDPSEPLEEWFKDYERRQHEDGDDQAKPRKRKQTSLGSGFIIDKAGFIVTNNHVVENADKISVTLHDDTVLDAKLVGRDEKTDIALLKITTTRELTPVPWGNSDKVRVGDWVLAIGNPFGLGGTVTSGIISARARDISAGQYDDFFQTDAAINKGNSGGPLFNMDGEVVGINTAIFSPSGASVGVGFAAAANLVKPVLSDLKQYGRTRRGWIGVQIQSVSPEMAESIGLDKARGAMIAEVGEGGPAQKAGLSMGDIILSFDGKPVDKMRALPRIVAETPIDKTVDVVIWRKGKQMTIKAKVAELKEEAPAAAMAAVTDDKAQAEKTELAALGLTVAPVTDRLRKRYQLEDSVNGLVVLDVDDDGDAASKGIRKGDVIDEIQQMAVLSVEEAKTALEKAKQDKRKSVLLRVLSGKKIGFVGIKLAG